jgi:hypothetical protein
MQVILGNGAYDKLTIANFSSTNDYQTIMPGKRYLYTFNNVDIGEIVT